MSVQIKIDLWENDRTVVKEVSPHFCVSRVTVWRWCQQGLSPAPRVGHLWHIRRKDLRCLLARSNRSVSDPNCPDMALLNDSKTQGPDQVPHFFPG